MKYDFVTTLVKRKFDAHATRVFKGFNCSLGVEITLEISIFKWTCILFDKKSWVLATTLIAFIDLQVGILNMSCMHSKSIS